MPIVSAAVMCHPSRRDAARRVAARLSPLAARVVADPEPDGPPATIRTARLAFDQVTPDATHHLVVQDDVAVPDGFAEAVTAALAARPEAAASLFVEWGSRTAALVRLAAIVGASWVPMINPYVPTQALALPAEVAREFARFLRSETTLDEADDEAALRFLRRAGVPTLVSVPNLVDHVDLPSLTGNAWHGPRRATCLPLGPPPAPGPAVLDLPASLPFLAWSTGTSVTLTLLDEPADEPAAGAGAAAGAAADDARIIDRRPTLDVLVERGADPADLAAACREAAADLPDPGFSHRWVFELWLTAAATGALLKGQLPAPATRALPARLAAADPDSADLAARAWRTMAPGGLRLVVDPDLLAARSETLCAIGGHGLAYGLSSLDPLPWHR